MRKVAIAMLLTLAGAGAVTVVAQPAQAASCRNYDARHFTGTYTDGRMCWSSTEVTVEGYVAQVGSGVAGATAEICIGSGGSCASVRSVASAGPYTTHYVRTYNKGSSQGAWMRVCAIYSTGGRNCTSWS
jgi:hypothetical protein